MEFTGTFNLKLINRQKGEGMRQSFRTTMKVIYLGSCAAYIAAIARQVPVLTGASRTALMWRVHELVQFAQSIDASATQKLNLKNIGRDISLTMTNPKRSENHVPTSFSGGESKREQWRDYLISEGQTAESWTSDQYVPLIISVSKGNRYSGNYQVFFAIKDFYLEHYDAGTIDSSIWHDKFIQYLEDTDQNTSIPEYPLGPWNLHLAGRRAFNRTFRRFIKQSGVINFRDLLTSIPKGLPTDYRKQVSLFGTVSEAVGSLSEEVPF